MVTTFHDLIYIYIYIYVYIVNNDNSVAIKKRILMANKDFYGLKRQFRSQFLSIENKIK